jgi:hypothetical protein
MLNLVLDDHMNDPTSNTFVPSLALRKMKAEFIDQQIYFDK